MERGKGIGVAALGGGTGLATLLQGMKEAVDDITAIVAVSDDGGSSGRLRTDLGCIPPGDIRNCLVALAHAEPLMKQLFQYRFHAPGKGLDGHAFGNLILAALADITGSFETAVRETGRVLAIRGRVLPLSLARIDLRALMADATWVTGESAITAYPEPIRRVELDPLDPEPLPEALAAIEAAGLVVIGPGSLYTSVAPTLLPSRVRAALRRNTGVKVYVCNVMTQPGETDGYTASDHVRALRDHGAGDCFDYVLVNTEPVPPEATERYRKSGAEPVVPDLDEIGAMGYVPLDAHLLNRDHYVRHDPARLARALLGIWPGAILGSLLAARDGALLVGGDAPAVETELITRAA
ncbi:MAG: YvcK family protein [Armatimonadetes bacterium]|nr:YvcK family protein [Armatimonadota bacterium]